MSKYASLEDILGKDGAELKALVEGEFQARKIGTIAFTAIDHDEYKQAKADSMKKVKNGTGGINFEIDEDKLQIRVIVLAVDKDNRSTFTFKSKELLEKLRKDYSDEGIISADQAVVKLMDPGEILRAAIAIQEASGFGDGEAKEVAETVKNS